MEDDVFTIDSALKPENDNRGYGFQFDRFKSISGAINIYSLPESNEY